MRNATINYIYQNEIIFIDLQYRSNRSFNDSSENLCDFFAVPLSFLRGCDTTEEDSEGGPDEIHAQS